MEEDAASDRGAPGPGRPGFSPPAGPPLSQAEALLARMEAGRALPAAPDLTALRQALDEAVGRVGSEEAAMAREVAALGARAAGMRQAFDGPEQAMRLDGFLGLVSKARMRRRQADRWAGRAGPLAIAELLTTGDRLLARLGARRAGLIDQRDGLDRGIAALCDRRPQILQALQ